LPVISLKLIAINYISGWFFIDFLACLPVSLIETIVSDGGSNFKLARLARLPRLYRLIKILRMIKMLRLFRKNGAIKDFINDLNISKGMKRLLTATGLVFWMVHLMSCFWYLAASLEENIFNTWVGARGIVD
jgi:ABC-type spermidine/putrescine transport system permease subunit I